MHELSIASAILEAARRNTPEDCLLKSVRIVAGPMRAIDEDAMQFAWQSVMQDAGIENVTMELKLLPWWLRCSKCGCQWTSEELDYRCECGSDGVRPVGGDELRIDSIEVDEAVQGVGHANLHR